MFWVESAKVWQGQSIFIYIKIFSFHTLTGQITVMYKPGMCEIWLSHAASFYKTHQLLSFHLFMMKHHLIIVER